MRKNYLGAGILGVAVLLGFLSPLFTSCGPKSSSPTSPSSPSNTNTFTITPTFALSATDTNTATPTSPLPNTASPTLTSTTTKTLTSTPTSSLTPVLTGTATLTSTPIPSSTPTVTSTLTTAPTQTNTSSPTHTPADTSTATAVDSPTPTLSTTSTNTLTVTNTITLTPTLTSTSTATPTLSATSTATITNTLTVTTTPTIPSGLTIQCNYTGSTYTVGTSRFAVEVSTDPNFASSPVTDANVGAAVAGAPPFSASITLALSAGTYYVGAELNETGAGKQFPLPSNNPVLGSPYAAFNGIVNNYYNSSINYGWPDVGGNSATPITYTGAAMSVTLSFADTYLPNLGFSGGPVFNNGGTNEAFASDQSVTLSNSTKYWCYAAVYLNNPGTFGTGPGNQTPANDWGTKVSSNMTLSCLKDLTASSSVYILEYLDPTANNVASPPAFAPIQTGDPYTIIGPVNPQTTDITGINPGNTLGVTLFSSSTWSLSTATATGTATPGETDTTSFTPTPDPSDSPTSTPTFTSTGGATDTPSSTLTITPDPSDTSTSTATSTSTVTDTPANTDTITDTPAVTSTPTGSPTIPNSPTFTGTYTNSPTVTPTTTSTVSPTPLPNLNPGDISFTGFVQNGSSEFSFISTKNLAAGQVIYFTNDSYDPTQGGLVTENLNYPSTASSVTFTSAQGNNVVISGGSSNPTTVSEGIIAYTVGSGGLTLGNQVVLSKQGNDIPQQQGGSAVSVAGLNNSGSGTVYNATTTVTSNWAGLILNHNGTGDKVLAFTVSGGVTQYIAGLIFGPDTWQSTGSIGSTVISSNTIPYFWDSYLPSNLTSGVNAVDLSGLWNSDNLNQYSTSNNINTLLLFCLNTASGINTSTNWGADGNVATGSLSLDGGKTAHVPFPAGVGTTACTTGNGGWLSIASEATPVPSSTPTVTSTTTLTYTATLCPTQTNTNTPMPNGATFSGAVTYSGAGTVDASHPLGVLFVSPGGNNGQPSSTFSSASTIFDYSIDGLNASNQYFIISWYNAYGDGTTTNMPHVGDSVYAYSSTDTSTCDISTWSQLATGQTGINMTFGDITSSYQAAGLSGTVTYTGSLAGVDGCHSIVVEMWPTGTSLTGTTGSVTCSGCNDLDDNSYNSNGAHADMIPFGASGFTGPCSTGTVNILAFFQAVPGTGNGKTIQPGDPYVWIPNFNITSTANNAGTITINDSQTY